MSLFLALPSHQFSPEARLAAGLGPADVVSRSGGLVRHSSDEPIGITAGPFGLAGAAAVVSVQSGANRLSLLTVTSDGLLTDPLLAASYEAGVTPSEAVAAPLTHDGLTDLVVLNRGSDDISIFLNGGKGGLIAASRVDAGNSPTGVAVRDVSGDGNPDLIVSNSAGDLLILAGQGDGTFKPLAHAGQTVSLAVGDFSGGGQTEFVLSDTSIDQLSVQYGETQSFVQGRSDGLKAPGAVAVADLNGDGMADIIVLDRGANAILIYLGLGGNRFQSPRRYFTGTDPEGLTIADLTGSGVPDLVVANEGSDDLSIFVGAGGGAAWELETGPRLSVGFPAISTTVGDLNGDAIPDLIAVARDSESAVILRGVGRGFFDDSSPIVLATGKSPIRAFAGKFDSGPGMDVVFLDSGSDDLTYYSDVLSTASLPQFISSGGHGPVAGVMAPADDGYDSLFIAQSGDSRISVFKGGPDGLKLRESLLLDQSLRPTDIALTSKAPGSFQLYVSGARADHVVIVTVNLSFGASGPAPFGNPQAPPGQASIASSQSASLFEQSGVLNLATLGNQPISQGQVFAQASTSSAAPAGAAASVGIAVATAPPVIPSIISPSLGALTFVVNNLFQFGQMQIADIMPLDNSPIDTVAVLQVVSGVSGESSNAQEIAMSSSLEPGTNAVAQADSLAQGTGSTRASTLERFLADWDGALANLSQDVLHAAERVPGPWPDGMARLIDSTRCAVKLASPSPDEGASESEFADHGPQLAVLAAAPGPGNASSDVSTLVDLSPAAPPLIPSFSVSSSWIVPLGETAMLASMLLAWRARKRWRADRPHATSATGPAGYHRPAPRFLQTPKFLWSRRQQPVSPAMARLSK